MKQHCTEFGTIEKLNIGGGGKDISYLRKVKRKSDSTSITFSKNISRWKASDLMNICFNLCSKIHMINQQDILNIQWYIIGVFF